MADRKSEFRAALEAAVLERHCANHPMTVKWAVGELGRNTMMGWAAEQYHWVRHMNVAAFQICATAPDDVVANEIDNVHEENDPDHSHLDIMLKFARANGGDVEKIKAGEGLPTTRSWVAWLCEAARANPWYCGVAALRIGTESQSPMLYAKLLPALREIYKFAEDDIEHFWLHSEVDIEHGGRGFEALERHCTTPEQQEMCIHFARESARMRWFHFDGIYMHYEMGYKLQ